MPSTGFLEKSVRVVSNQVTAQKEKERGGLPRTRAVLGGLLLAGTVFFVLKAAAIASGIGLPGTEGVALWLAGPDPISSAVSSALQPIFAGRS